MITNDDKNMYLGATGYSDFTIHKDKARKQRYIHRHEKMNVNPGIDTPSFWFLFSLGI